MRRLLAALVVTAAQLVVLGSPTATGSPRGNLATDETVAYQIDPAHDGYLDSTTPTPPLVPKWRRTFNGLVSYPLIAEGKVFVIVGYYSTRLNAYDAATGATLWTQSAGGRSIYAVYDSGRIFAIDDDGTLRAFNAGDGSLLWRKQLPYEYVFASPPTASGGIVYVGGSGNIGRVYAVDESTGTVLWIRLVSNGHDGAPTISSNGVYIACTCAEAFKFDLTTGARIWHHESTCYGGGGTTPVYHDYRLYITDGGLYAPPGTVLDSETGQVVGEQDMAGPVPAFAGNIAVFVHDGTAQGRDVSTGRMLWSFPGDGGLTSAPIIVGTTVYVGSTTGMVFGLNLDDGQQVWEADVGEPIPGTSTAGLAAGQGVLAVPAGTYSPPSGVLAVFG